MNTNKELTDQEVIDTVKAWNAGGTITVLTPQSKRSMWTGRVLTTVIVLSALVLLLGLVGCAAPAPGHAPNTRPGSEAVYDRIESLSDCTALQVEFDTAAANHDRQQAGTEEARASTAYMEAAQHRAQEVGCFD